MNQVVVDGPNQPPQVAVVVTTYNRLDLLGATLASISTQSFAGFEVCVVDDGSRQDPTSLVESFGPRFRCLRQRNAGQPAARNRGVAATRAPLIAFVDDDDLWLPEKLALQVAMLDSDPDLGWCYSDGLAFSHEDGVDRWRWSERCGAFSGTVAEQLALGNFIPSPSVMARRRLLEQAGGFDPSPQLRLGEDWLMWLKLSSLAPVGVVATPCFRLRIHGGSMTRLRDGHSLARIARGHAAILTAACRFAPRRFLPLVVRSLFRNRMLLTRQAWEAGRPLLAAPLVAQMLRLAPRLAAHRPLQSRGNACAS